MSVTNVYKTLTLSREQVTTLTFALEDRIRKLNDKWRAPSEKEGENRDVHFEGEIAYATALLAMVQA